jgi:hypothetical protein
VFREFPAKTEMLSGTDRRDFLKVMCVVTLAAWAFGVVVGAGRKKRSRYIPIVRLTRS